MKTTIKTDTATIVVFDPARMFHRKGDDGDWWSIEQDELAEMNDGNALFFGVGVDGIYRIEIVDLRPSGDDQFVQANVKVDSGKVFIGAAEWTTGGELEPEALYGNVILDFPPGSYCVWAWREDSESIFLNFERILLFIPNAFRRSQRLA